MKGTTRTFLLLMALAIILSSAYVFAATGNPPIVRVIRPVNNSASNNTNDTLSFSFNISTNQSSASCRMAIDNAWVNASTSINNETNTGSFSNTSLSQGRHRFEANCTQTVGGAALNFTSGYIVFFTDSGIPPNAVVASTSPTDLANQSTNETVISCNTRAFVDTVFDNVNLSLILNGTINQTTQGAVANVTYNFTVPFPDAVSSGTWAWNCRITDNATNLNETTNRTLIVDRQLPEQVNAISELSEQAEGIHRSLQYNWSVRDMTYVDRCWALVYDQGGVTFRVNGTRNVTTGAKETMCHINISDMGTSFTYGRIRVEGWANDSVGNANTTGLNQTNLTLLKLYPGWNLIYVDRNTTMGAISNYSSNITQVSFYNNTLKVFTTYVKGVAAQEGALVGEGTATYVYANQTLFLGRNWSVDGGNVAINYSVSSGWNTIVQLNNSGLKFYEVCNEGKRAGQVFNNTGANITAVSFFMPNESKYMSHFCFMKYNNNTVVPKGFGYWVNLNGSEVTNVTTGFMIRRSPDP